MSAKDFNWEFDIDGEVKTESELDHQLSFLKNRLNKNVVIYSIVSFIVMFTLTLIACIFEPGDKVFYLLLFFTITPLSILAIIHHYFFFNKIQAIDFFYPVIITITILSLLSNYFLVFYIFLFGAFVVYSLLLKNLIPIQSYSPYDIKPHDLLILKKGSLEVASYIKKIKYVDRHYITTLEYRGMINFISIDKENKDRACKDKEIDRVLGYN